MEESELWLLFVVVGRSADNGTRSVKLFPNDQPGHIARENSRGKTPEQISFLPQLFTQAVRPADDDTQGFNAGEHLLIDVLRETGRT